MFFDKINIWNYKLFKIEKKGEVTMEHFIFNLFFPWFSIGLGILVNLVNIFILILNQLDAMKGIIKHFFLAIPGGVIVIVSYSDVLKDVYQHLFAILSGGLVNALLTSLMYLIILRGIARCFKKRIDNCPMMRLYIWFLSFVVIITYFITQFLSRVFL